MTARLLFRFPEQKALKKMQSTLMKEMTPSKQMSSFRSGTLLTREVKTFLAELPFRVYPLSLRVKFSCFSLKKKHVAHNLLERDSNKTSQQKIV